MNIDDDLKLFRAVLYVATEEVPSLQINSMQAFNGAILKSKDISCDTISEIQSCIAMLCLREN